GLTAPRTPLRSSHRGPREGSHQAPPLILGSTAFSKLADRSPGSRGAHSAILSAAAKRPPTVLAHEILHRADDPRAPSTPAPREGKSRRVTTAVKRAGATDQAL